jgi:hypothetical protein
MVHPIACEGTMCCKANRLGTSQKSIRKVAKFEDFSNTPPQVTQGQFATYSQVGLTGIWNATSCGELPYAISATVIIERITYLFTGATGVSASETISPGLLDVLEEAWGLNGVTLSINDPYFTVVAVCILVDYTYFSRNGSFILEMMVVTLQLGPFPGGVQIIGVRVDLRSIFSYETNSPTNGTTTSVNTVQPPDMCITVIVHDFRFVIGSFSQRHWRHCREHKRCFHSRYTLRIWNCRV